MMDVQERLSVTIRTLKEQLSQETAMYTAQRERMEALLAIHCRGKVCWDDLKAMETELANKTEAVRRQQSQREEEARVREALLSERRRLTDRYEEALAEALDQKQRTRHQEELARSSRVEPPLQTPICRGDSHAALLAAEEPCGEPSEPEESEGAESTTALANSGDVAATTISFPPPKFLYQPPQQAAPNASQAHTLVLPAVPRPFDFTRKPLIMSTFKFSNERSGS